MGAGFEHLSISAARLRSRPSLVHLAIRGSTCAFVRARIARTFAARFLGLLGRKALREGEGLLFVPGGSIHTLWMRFAIDAVFLDAEMTVLKVAANVRPWRFARAPHGTRYVVELGAGRAAAAQLSSGTIVLFQDS